MRRCPRKRLCDEDILFLPSMKATIRLYNDSIDVLIRNGFEHFSDDVDSV